MPIAILMPALSPTMEEGTLAIWHVKEGDTVSSGDVIAEIETDKATMEVEAVDEGVLGRILTPAGSEGVLVNTPIAMLLAEGESAADITPETIAETGASAGRDKRAARAPENASPSDQHGDQGNHADQDDQSDMIGAKNTASPMPAPPAIVAQGSGTALDRIKASPLARRMAKEAGLDLAVLSGTGPGGRIVKRDIEAAHASGAGVSAPLMQAAAQAAQYAPPAGLDPLLYPPDSYNVIKNDNMRKVIASRLTQSFNQEVPHFPLVIDCEIDTLMTARRRMNALSPAEGDGAYKLSVNDFIIKAAAMALIKVPAANASYTTEALILHKHADIGVAVAIEGGLITPIIREAEAKGLVEISRSVREMAARARARRLRPEEYQGGTFSISNLGMYGIRSFASIINQPQGCIMSVGAGEQRPIVRDGALEIATVMTVTLTCDHRVVDGAVGAAFLAAFKAFIEEPASMLL